MNALRLAWKAWNEDKAQRLAASIAYSTIFALAPLLIVVTALIGTLLGSENGARALGTVLDEVRRSAGPQAAGAARDLIAAGFGKPRHGIVAQVVGWVLLIVGAGGAFSALQDALNAVWRIESTEGGWRRTVRDRGAGFGMVLAGGFVLLVSLVANAGIAVIAARFERFLPPWLGPRAATSLDQLVSVAVVAVVFALMFKVLPAVDIQWRDVWPGALLTAVLFVAGEALIGWYFALAGVTSAYGAAGSVLALLLWIYYSALILLFGAECTKVRARRATLEAPSTLRTLIQRPAGADPRT